MRLHLRWLLCLGLSAALCAGAAFWASDRARAQETESRPPRLESRAVENRAPENRAPENRAPESRPAGESRAAGVLAPATTRRTAITLAVERVRAAVVNIHSERTIAGVAASDLTHSHNRINGMGTGIVIDPRGYLVTNHHVIDEVNTLRVRLADGTTCHAQVVARSPDTDLALLKIDADRPLPTMPLGTANDLMVGETVIALGNAYGYEHTVSLGIVRALKRDVVLNKELTYRSLIQTDASINPGNSGGPLVNINGELVGVNVAIRAGAQGIGFAIPVDSMLRTAASLLRARRSAAEGFSVRDQVEASGDHLVRRAVVERVEPNGPAEASGLRAGDVLSQVGDVTVVCGLDVERALLERKAGDQVAVVVRRQDKEQRLSVALAAPEPRLRAAPTKDAVWQKLGMQLAAIDSEAVTRVNRQLNGGLQIVAVQNDGPAARAGTKKGDILVGLHQWETLNLDNVAFVLGHPELSTFNPLRFYILRGEQVRSGSLGLVP